MAPVPGWRHPDVLNGARALDVGEREHLLRLDADRRRDLPADPEITGRLCARPLRGHSAAAFLAGEVFRADRSRLRTREAVEIADPRREAVEGARGCGLPRRTLL